MPISALAGVMPALASASFTASKASGGVTMYQAEPSSFKSSAPASSTRSKHLVFAGRFFGDDDFALAAEHPSDGAGFGHVAAVLAHHVAHFADGAIAIGGDDLNQHADAARAVAFESDFFVLLAFELPGAAENGALDVVVGHVLVLGRKNGGAQAGIGIRVAAADARSDGDFANQSREDAATLGVRCRLLVFNRGPF